MLVMPSPKSRMKCPRVRLAPVLRGGTTPRGGLAGGSRSATRRGRDSCDFMGKRALWVKRRTRTRMTAAHHLTRGEASPRSEGPLVYLASTRRVQSPTNEGVLMQAKTLVRYGAPIAIVAGALM